MGRRAKALRVIVVAALFASGFLIGLMIRGSPFALVGDRSRPGGGGSGPCPLSSGFWMNHPGDWTVDTLRLGAFEYNRTALRDLLKMPSRGDASVILAQQLIAAKLNVASGSDASPASDPINRSDDLLAPFAGPLPYDVAPSTEVGRAMGHEAGILDRYNNALLTAGCDTCAPPADSGGPHAGILAPDAAGTVRYEPERNVLEPAPVGSTIQSSYFRTAPANREFRRGFVEFAIPAFPGPVEEAMLVIQDTGAVVADPFPPERHELSSYAGDGVVDASDFDRATSLAACFEADPNVGGEVFVFNVTELVRAYQGSILGFRVKLALDPTFVGYEAFGAEFGSLAGSGSPRIEVFTAP